MSAITAEDLRPLALFAELDDAALAEWAAPARPLELAPGDRLADETVLNESFQMLLEGELDLVRRENGRETVSAVQSAPTWMGAVPILSEIPFGVQMRARTPVRLALLPADDFRRLLFAHPSVHRAVMRTFAPTLNRLAGLEAQRDKLAALGTMSAGLAHELNNPAAAARRSAEELAEALEVLSSTIGVFVESGVSREQAQGLVVLHRDAVERYCARPDDDEEDPLAASDREADWTGWLEDEGVPEAWRVAEPLAAAGLEREWLDRVRALAGPAAGAALRWVAATMAARGLAGELRTSTERMSDLVGAVKAYTYMDQDTDQVVDVNLGIKATLKILHHKLKHTSIVLRKDLDPDVPRIRAYGGELNQVWTNLIDNAIDALGDAGTITITTRATPHGGVEVTVADDGPGIPEAVRATLFDPFVTTKPVGEGTGLGLQTARRIVADRHGGTLEVESRPGDTRFIVTLPPAGAGSLPPGGSGRSPAPA